ncbi:hypothetical protein GTO27_07440 [Candidatus Bathyarchaeota archaeon]|nr:hypothetical protein [Candidatus Bathyarchaeota archaeon]
MKWKYYQLDTEVSKTTQDITLWKNEKGIVEIAKGTLAVRVLLDNQSCGYIFHGKGNLILDTIVETDKGAIGKSVERVVNEPFLMLGKLDEGLQSLDKSNHEDFTRCGHESKQQFMPKAEGLLEKFFEGSTCDHRNSKAFDEGASAFAFPNKKGKLDILVAKDTKLVYTSTDEVFVSKGEKTVLTTPRRVVVSKPTQSISVEKNYDPKIHISRGDHECPPQKGDANEERN